MMKNTIDNFLNIHFMNGKLIEDLSKIRRKPSPNAGGDIRRKARRALGQATPAYSG
ncbi:TPA_asm: hypothetical protein GND03_004362 [Salmonella enterica subsp. houtenae serovar 16:z4,z32:-]|uniref:Uncharacterized protein n=1 Tax=Salmonella enterica subsp. houtenae serovar 16:z4,z32:- TaxID=1307497 RepID=A0A735L3R9_SALHO|nr:hypothetical protein [Salmonella enterica subsp. houtenae]EDS7539694.1 hypothetical protein [Salmonella enterica subsp. enterica]EDZ6267105.1 hypothetical protein [Salmonella enterica]HAE4182609.1 hypothetical protein [Salmonella enterica subsp. houtenae serovar 16:z4,z32:-]EDV4895037.1 hypothetical protein [Salmonella enterica subsp. houtenae]